jgi:hypothetical protein|tara:strand:+ start:1510 stop:2319 length:810 start_codon:yes stop_codon:yes gene_type:complete
MKTLLASYSGEFGHELFSFQGRIRHVSSQYERVIVRTSPSMRFLYEDFTSDFIDQDQEVDHDDYINEFSFKPRGAKGVSCQQSYVKYGKFINQKYDLIIHARSKAVTCVTKNLNEDFYCRLHEKLSTNYKVCFIGSQKNSLCPDGAEDLRGASLRELADIIHSSRLVVGSSSGPIHFASLCGAPHLLWGGNLAKTFYRYTHFWNPFKTSCYILNDYENSLDYLTRRGRLFRVKLKEVCKGKHVNLIQAGSFHYPTVKEITSNVNKILNG